jgi:hypothetical protein
MGEAKRRRGIRSERGHGSQEEARAAAFVAALARREDCYGAMTTRDEEQNDDG